MVGGHWLQIAAEDLRGEVQTSNSTGCFLKIKSIDAAFNILGSQAYIGYYIEHNFGDNTLTITPHPDSLKPSLTAAVTVST